MTIFEYFIAIALLLGFIVTVQEVTLRLMYKRPKGFDLDKRLKNLPEMKPDEFPLDSLLREIKLQDKYGNNKNIL